LRAALGAVNDEGRPRTAALGDGNLNFFKILREAEAADCQHYVIEQDTGPGVDAFAEIEKSWRYLQSS
jgi:sugar phosphate isomerase/epimerase